MSLAETATLAVNLKLGTSGSFAGATSQIKGVEAAAASATTRGIGALRTGFGVASNAAGKFGGALSHAKGAVGELLTGPLGVLGLAGGVGGLGLTFEHIISHTNDFAFSVEKLTELTGGSAESMSTLLAVFEKFNIDAQRTGQIVGFAEKTLGNLAKTTTTAGKSASDLAKAQDNVTKAHEKLILASTKLREVQAKSGATASQLQAAQFRVRDATLALNEAETKLAEDRASKGATSTSKLIQLDTEYGLHLIDTKGKLVSFDSELKQVADVYTSSIDPAKKAALAAQLFGRGYADLVPILALGSKGITDAEQAAKDLGLTLTSQNAKDLAAYRESLRETGDAIGGLELQIGLALIPAIKDMADAITRFLANGGRQQIVGFFKSAIAAGRDFAGFVTGTVVPTVQFLAGAAKTFWDSIPAPLRDLIVKGVVADKAIKFLFGIDIAGSAVNALKNAVAEGFGKSIVGAGLGKLFVQPVFVTNPGFGALGGAAAGEAGVVEGAAAGAAAPVALIGAAFATIVGAPFYLQWLSKTFGIGNSYNPAATNTNGLLPAGVHTGSRTPNMPGAGQEQPGSGLPIGSFGSNGFANANGREDRASMQTIGATQALADLKDKSQGTAAQILAMGKASAEAQAALHKYNPAKEVAYLLKGVAARGEAKTGKAPAPSAIEATFERDLLRYEKNILTSHQTAQQKITSLERWEKIAVQNKDWGVATKLKKEIVALQTKVDNAKKAQVAATQADTQAIKDKDLSVTIPVAVQVNATVSSRNTTTVQARQNRYYKVPT